MDRRSKRGSYCFANPKLNNQADNLTQSIASFGVDRGADDWQQAVRENPGDSLALISSYWG